MKERKRSMEDKKEELEKEQKIWYSRNENNRIVREHLKKICEKLEKLQEDYTCLGTLDQTANGNLSGAVKIDFESYVQRQYFRQIIGFANQRLNIMTGGAFLLKCRAWKIWECGAMPALTGCLQHGNRKSQRCTYFIRRRIF